MAIKLYGSWAYSCTQRVIATLLEKEVPFEVILVDLAKGEGKSPEHLLRHPFGKVPILDDGGFMIYESRAICRYIEHKFAAQGTDLSVEKTDQNIGLFEQAANLEQNYFDTAASGIAFEKVYTYFTGGKTDQAKLGQHVADLRRVLALYDKTLSQQKFIAANKLTLVDILHLPILHYIKKLGHGDVLEEHPNVRDWAKTLLSRESWQKILAAQE